VKEMPRGQAEPEFENMAEMQTFKFSWTEAREIFKKKTMWFIFLQGFAGVFPWNVITFFFFGYLEKERGYDANGILFTMAPVIRVVRETPTTALVDGGGGLGHVPADLAMKLAMTSIAVPRKRAARMPAGTPMATAIRIDRKVS
jgi:hypothetical protein